MNRRINIIMCTYNGEKYIKPQLDSILNQTYKNFKLYIKDDGSSDNTISIINEYCKKDSRIILIDGPEHLGYPKCFMYALFHSEASEYYAFCDQDDIWNNDKIENGLQMIGNYHSNFPVLYFSNVDYYDGNMNFLRNSRFSTNYNGSEVLPVEIALFGGDALGMTYIFNNEVRNILEIAYKNGYKNFKDGFIKIYCALAGTVLYNKKSSAKYRRHINATTSKSNPTSLFNRYYSMVKQLFFDKNTKYDFDEVIEAIEVLFDSNIKDENRRIYKILSQNNLKSNLQKFFWKKRYRVKLIDEIGYRVALLVGRI